MRMTGDGAIGAIEGPTRRDLLKAGGLGALGLGLAGRSAVAAGPGGEGAVILLMMVGGPSQLETFDPKPDGPERGPRAVPPDRDRASPASGSSSTCPGSPGGWAG